MRPCSLADLGLPGWLRLGVSVSWATLVRGSLLGLLEAASLGSRNTHATPPSLEA